MARGARMGSMAICLSLSAMCHPALGQEVEDAVTSVTNLSDGAVFEEKIGVDGAPVTETYLMTRLTCQRGETAIDVALPIAREDSLPQDGSTLREDKGAWYMTLRAGKKKIEKSVSFLPIEDKTSLLNEATVISIEHGDVIWKALIDQRGDQLLALSGGFGEFQGVSDDANLRKFEKICGLQR